MKLLALCHPPNFCSPPQYSLRSKFQQKNTSFCVSCSSIGSESGKVTTTSSKAEYKPGIIDNLLLTLFRKKMVAEVEWDSEKPGYDGLIEVVNCLMMKGQTNSETQESAVRILKSLFPPLLLELFKMLIAPLGSGKIAAMMVARVTALSCQWLMGTCKVNAIDLPDGSSCRSGTFFKDYMGVPLLMEPNFSDYSCQFQFGVLPPQPSEDKTLKEPCLEMCPNAFQHQGRGVLRDEAQCSKVN
ncbi:beta-carotene isomerase D27, chloroplastic isoform X2 [Telopea speciosissima]|uniref:beta-carotene isomerase D27, chloroplastic isoform X2 n=1 Tax=Telopea speciosissima TaxID=54955 RepID=UPI001CC3C30E|nr:beta-carotene isomerase D27, chloroplastic isoform X2 [Telopea speciosissima]